MAMEILAYSADTERDLVAEAAVFASPGADGSLVIHAAVIPSNSSVTARTLAVALQPLLSPAAIPADISLHENFPRTTSGKIDRNALADSG